MFKDEDKNTIMFTRGNPQQCLTCAYSHGSEVWENSPWKANCLMYPYELGVDKPASVFYDGGPCEYYKREEQ